MEIGKNHDQVDKYARVIIRNKARKMIGMAGLNQSDINDLEQDLMLDLLQRTPSFNAEHACWHTFIVRVVDHRAATILETRLAAKRNVRFCTCSLNDLMEDGEGGAVQRHETMDQDAHHFRMGKFSRSKEDLRNLALDFAQFVSGLPSQIQEILRRLKTETITQLSKDTGIPRSTIYRWLRKLRPAAEDAGLGDYL